jgi:tripartite-type tricarboxylate transporter receptor subunit TctC
MKKLFLLLMLPLMAHAWEPTKLIESYTPFTAGSANEIAFRIVTKEIEKTSNARFVVMNKPGASGSIADQFISSATPDGYTVGVLSVPAIGATDKMMLPNKEFSAKDFTYTVNIASIPMTIVALPDDPVNNISDLAKVLKTEKTTIGDPGAAARLVYELMINHIGFKEGADAIVRVQYKGPADTLNDLMAKNIRFGIMPLTVSYQNHIAGKVKIIAVTSDHKIKSLPNVNTASSVYPDFVFNLEVGAILPRNTPKEVAAWYATEFKKAVLTKEVQDSLESNMMFVNKNLLTPDQYTKYVLGYEKRYTPIVNKVISTQ